MKKIISLLLVLTLALSLAACGGNNNESEQTNAPNVPNETSVKENDVQETEAPQESEAPVAAAEGFTFSYNGVEIAMNANAADILAQLGEPKSYTEEASCAFVGLDKTYFYGSFYLQTYPVGEEDFVYCAWLVDDSLTTDEGIYIGATQAEVESAYGTEGFNGSNAYILTAGDSKLTIILKDGVVNSIQYDAIVE